MPSRNKTSTGEHHYSVNDIFYNGCSFASCGALCRTARNPALYTAPMVVNYAFSCESFLKALLQIYNISGNRIHKLRELYQLLPEEVKVDIDREMFEKTGRKIDIWGLPLLDQISNAFVDWRYTYEKIPTETAARRIDSSYLACFCETLRNTCCQNIFHMSYLEYLEKMDLKSLNKPF